MRSRSWTSGPIRRDGLGTGAQVEQGNQHQAAGLQAFSSVLEDLAGAARGDGVGVAPAGRPGCAYCLAPFSGTRPATVDHVVPRSRSGSNELANLVAACYPCNQAKGTMSAVAFRGLLELSIAA